MIVIKNSIILSLANVEGLVLRLQPVHIQGAPTVNERYRFFSFLISSIILFAGICRSQTGLDHLLLKNYRPVSIYKIPYTVIKKARYPVLDMHSHPFYISSEKELDHWVKLMDSVGIRKTVILTMDWGEKFDSLAHFFSKYRDRFILYCGFDYTGYDKPGYDPTAVKELEKCYKEGSRGVGELGDKGKGLYFCYPPAYGMHIADPRLDPLLDECAKLKMPISIHLGEPQWFYEPMDSTNDGVMNAYNWRLDNQKEILTLDQELNHFARAVARHPMTIFITCHLANQVTDLAKLAKLFDKYPNLYADLGARYGEIASIPGYAKAFFEKYQDRIVYGTDNSPTLAMYQSTFTILETRDEQFYNFDFGYHWPLYGLRLSNASLKRIFWDNAEKVLKMQDQEGQHK